MSLLQRFAIQFETNANKAAKDIKNIDKTTQDLGKTAHKTDDSFSELIGTLKGTAAAWLSFEVLKSGVIDTSADIEELGRFAARAGEHVELMSALSQINIDKGGNIGDLSEDIKRLNDQANDFSMTGGGEGADVFERFGISVKDSEGKLKLGSNLLLELSDHFAKLDKQESSGLGEMMGFSEGTITMLQQGRHALELMIDRKKQMGVVDDKQVKAAKDFNDQWRHTKQVFSNAFRSGITSILPFITKLLNGLNSIADFMRDNKVFVMSFFGAIAGIITVMYLPAILSAAAATWALVAPFLAVGAAVAAVAAIFALAVDDVYSFLEGNESVTGKLVAYWKDSTNKIKAYISKAFSDAKQSVSDAMDNVEQSVSNTFDNVKSSVVEAMDDVKKGITDGFQRGIDSVYGMFNKLIDWLKSSLTGITDFIPDFLMGDNDLSVKVKGNIEAANKYNDNANNTASVINNHESNMKAIDNTYKKQQITNHNNSTNNQPVTIHSKPVYNITSQTGDPKQIAEQIEEHTRIHYNDLMTEYDNGIKA